MILIVVITDYYTSTKYGPVRKIAEAAKAGGGPTVISGISVGLESTWLPGLVLVAGILVAYASAGWYDGYSPTPNAYFGLYGIGLAAASMLSVTGMIISIDAFGPITDNAGGIAEMAKLPEHARAITDPLDAVGNTTKAITKGYAIGSAVLAALALFAAYTFAAAAQWGEPWATFTSLLTLSTPLLVAGLVIGAILPFFFTSYLMNAVGIAAEKMVVEIRRQFRDIPGLLQGTAKADYGKSVDIVTVTALRQLAVPALIAVVTPLAVGFLLGPVALAGLLLGTIVSGFPLALTMTTGGAAWDNGKKYIESGHFGGKGSDAHKAAIVGDTVGDATKDTAGPAINPLIKVVNTISILFIALIVAHSVIHLGDRRWLLPRPAPPDEEQDPHRHQGGPSHEDPPLDVRQGERGDAFTVRLNSAVTVDPRVSVARTWTVQVPVAVGVQPRTDEFALTQPGGRPVNE